MSDAVYGFSAGGRARQLVDTSGLLVDADKAVLAGAFVGPGGRSELDDELADARDLVPASRRKTARQGGNQAEAGSTVAKPPRKSPSVRIPVRPEDVPLSIEVEEPAPRG